jgi:hypothetical protein
VQVAAASESNVCTEVELVNRLSSLLTELEPFEPKLLQFNKKTKIKLRKEQENYEEEPADEEKVRPADHLHVWQGKEGTFLRVLLTESVPS